jgi:protein-tyrosine-phosphatase
VLDAVNASAKADPKQVLADAGYRSEEEMAKRATSKLAIELVIALGREGRQQAKPIDAERYQHTVAMQTKFQTDKGARTTANANGLLSHPTVGSRIWWASGNSVCGV